MKLLDYGRVSDFATTYNSSSNLNLPESQIAEPARKDYFGLSFVVAIAGTCPGSTLLAIEQTARKQSGQPVRGASKCSR